MRRLYAFTNRNPPLPVQAYEDDRENVRIIRREQTTNDNVVRNENRTIVRKTTNQVENYDTDVRYVQSENVYLNESARCPYVRFPWWLWLLLGLGLLTLLALGLGLGLGLGLKKPTANSRCSGNNCPANSQCINNRCECNSGYFYDYTLSKCSAYRHVGMTCSTSYTSQQCVANANCASNGYCVCNSGYFLDQVWEKEYRGDRLQSLSLSRLDLNRITGCVPPCWLDTFLAPVMTNVKLHLSVEWVCAIAIRPPITIRARTPANG